MSANPIDEANVYLLKTYQDMLKAHLKDCASRNPKLSAQLAHCMAQVSVAMSSQSKRTPRDMLQVCNDADLVLCQSQDWRDGTNYFAE
ncbi:MAG: hypothetical protein SF123_10915 [Chloroflexota bacterium]|nr:hypothetical protein [Chloroflexota bacterium]